MNNWETVIGIEIHIELNTKTKMFSAAPNNFHAGPNTNASLIDVAYPGTLPVLNKQAVKKAIMLAKALEMKIDHELHFDRKNYFYADLPKGFQITQNFRPIGIEGILPIVNNKKVSIERIHLEEDTARSNHNGKYTTLDYNRAGIPLIEIVTNPVIKNAQEAISYISTIRSVAKILDISDAKMEEGSLRADINISLKPRGSQKLGTKVEIKNLNSLSNVEKAIEKEIAHQIETYKAGKEVIQSTKRFDESKQDVVVMRDKIETADYRYFAEPNIPIIVLSQQWIDDVILPELPWEIATRLSKFGVDQEFIQQLVSDPFKMSFINQFGNKNLSKIIKIYFAEVVAYANNKNLELQNINIDVKQFEELITRQEAGEISGSHIKKIMPILIETNKLITEIIEKHNFKLISDPIILGKMIDTIIQNNEKFIGDNKDRLERVSKFILGQLMKESKGQANPIIANQIVIKKIGARNV